MNRSERKRIEKLIELAFDRVIHYCIYVAKLDLEVGCDEYFVEVSQKIGLSMSNYEKKLNTQYSDLNAISIINEVINEVDFNLNSPPSDVATFISSFVRFQVDPDMKLISGFKI